MGAWGHGSFENDDALDFVPDLTGEATWAPARGAFASALEAGCDAELEVTEASHALAAAEAVAAALGRPSAGLPEEVAAWVAAVEPPDAELVDHACRAVERVLNGSELQGLWDESSDAASWHREVEGLLRRLCGAGE